MGSIISLHADPHRESQRLLPWYVTGRLEAEDLAYVEAHLAECQLCREDRLAEQSLRDGVAGLPIDAALSFANLRGRLEQMRPDKDQAAPRAASWRRWTSGVLAAQAAMFALWIGVYRAPTHVQPAYHTLSAAPAKADGNIVVIFRPDATEVELRRALALTGAHFVDGPTAADAYVLHVPVADRSEALAALRAQHAIVLAEPIDAPAR